MCLADLLLVLSEETALPEIKIPTVIALANYPCSSTKESTIENVNMCVPGGGLGREKESISDSVQKESISVSSPNVPTPKNGGRRSCRAHELQMRICPNLKRSWCFKLSGCTKLEHRKIFLRFGRNHIYDSVSGNLFLRFGGVGHLDWKTR